MTDGDDSEARTDRPLDYGRSFADVYDDWYADVSDVEGTVDRVVALASAAGGARVVELGVGSGRIALPLAARGLAVEGVDSSDEMLALLAAKPGAQAVRTVRGDMAELDSLVEPGAAVVLVTFNTFFNLDTAERQQRCLEAVARVLAPDGSLVVEAFVPADPPERVERELSPARVELDRLVLTATEHDPATQTVTGQHLDITAAGVRLRPWRIRYLTPIQLDAMAAEAGLVLAERRAGWRDEPITEAATTHVSRYVRRPPAG